MNTSPMTRRTVEFAAVIGVLMITVAIVEVPRTHMRPPEAALLDSQSWRTLPENQTSSTLLSPQQVSVVTLESADTLDRASFWHGPFSAGELDQMTAPGSPPGQRRLAELQRDLERGERMLGAEQQSLAKARADSVGARNRLAQLEQALLSSMSLPGSTPEQMLSRHQQIELETRDVFAATRALNQREQRLKDLQQSVAEQRVENRSKLSEFDALIALRNAAPDRP